MGELGKVNTNELLESITGCIGHFCKIKRLCIENVACTAVAGLLSQPFWDRLLLLKYLKRNGMVRQAVEKVNLILFYKGHSMKKYMVAFTAVVMFAPVFIQANSDDTKQIQLERRLEQLQNEVNEIRQSLESPRDNIESNYVLEVIDQVKNNWFFPEDLQVTIDDFLRVALKISRDGSIIGQEIIKSSGNDRFNSYALECISKSTPLPAMPIEMRQETVELELRFRPPQN